MNRKLALLVLTGLVACDGPLFGGQEGEDFDDTGASGGDGGWDGGSADGGSADGGSTGGGDTGLSERVATAARTGSLLVTDDSATGTETLALTGAYGDVACSIDSGLSSTAALSTCKACTWAFSMTSADSVTTSTTGCDLVGLSATDLDGRTFEYGFAPGYLDGQDALMYGYAGAWYPVGTAVVAGDELTYTWDDQPLWPY